jgi:hypothetical protein
MSEQRGITPGLSVDTASQLAKSDPVLAKNTEPGFANTYGKPEGLSLAHGLIAAPALGMGALSLYLLYQKKKQDERDRLEAEQLNPKLASLADIKAQLPGVHVPDILLGGAGGAAAGALYDYFKGAPKEKRYATALKRILGGAAIGAAGTNLLGDRARRYITNSVAGPFGYDAGNILQQLKPRSLQHVIDAAVLDKPSYDPAALAKITPHFGNNPEIALTATNARRELGRIGMGVHSTRPDSDIWQRNVGGKGPDYYSLNEKNKEYLKHLQHLFLPSQLRPNALFSYEDAKANIPPGQLPTPEQWAASQKNIDVSNLFKQPGAGIPFINNESDWRNVDMLGSQSLLGSQQVIAKPDGQNLAGRILDRYDVTPSAQDSRNALMNLLTGKFLSSSWRNQTPAGNDYTRGQTNAQILKGTLGRELLDKILIKQSPWVSQRFQFKPSEIGGYGLQLQKEDGTPATDALTPGELAQYLESIQK